MLFSFLPKGAHGYQPNFVNNWTKNAKPTVHAPSNVLTMKLQQLNGLTGWFLNRCIVPATLSRLLSCVGLAMLLAGCATTQKKEKGPKYVFFPPAPDAPRLQFLTAYNSDRDMRSGGRDSFLTYLTGKQPDYTPILKPYGGATLPGHLPLRTMETVDCETPASAATSLLVGGASPEIMIASCSPE